MALVIDTGVLVAAARPREPEHEACARLLTATEGRRVVPAPVLVEVEYFLRGGQGWSLLLDDVLGGGLSIEELSLSDYARVKALMDSYRDLRPGFVDCAVLAVVERLGEQRLATLDHRHFSVMQPTHVPHLELLPAV